MQKHNGRRLRNYDFSLKWTHGNMKASKDTFERLSIGHAMFRRVKQHVKAHY